MKTRLDRIETRLQSVIESSVNLFAQSAAQRRLAHLLVEVIHGNIRTGGDGRALAPSEFVIHLHPTSLAYWQRHSDLLEEIGRNLQVVLQEHAIFFMREPVLRISADPGLAESDLRVTVVDTPPRNMRDTAAFPLSSILPQPAAAPHNAFLIVEGSQVFPLNRSVVNIGRRSDNHLVIDDPRVSRTHAQLRVVRGQYVLFDLNSTGGTTLNGHPVSQAALKPGDVISLAGVPLIYGEDAPPDDDDVDESTQAIDIPPQSPKARE